MRIDLFRFKRELWPDLCERQQLAQLRPWFAKGPSLDEPFVASRQLPPNYLAGSAYVQHRLKPLRVTDVMHLFLMCTPSHFSEIMIGRHQRHRGHLSHIFEKTGVRRQAELVRLLMEGEHEPNSADGLPRTAGRQFVAT